MRLRTLSCATLSAISAFSSPTISIFPNLFVDSSSISEYITCIYPSIFSINRTIASALGIIRTQYRVWHEIIKRIIPSYIERCLVIPQVVSQIFEEYMHFTQIIVFKKYSYKSIINNGGLVREKIHVYNKFTYTTKLNNI